MKRIRITRAVAAELREWLGGALCGHGSRLSAKAQRAWKRMLKCEFQCEVIII